MIVIPAIDLKDGRCVRLRQGDLAQETVYSGDPVAMARHWYARGASLLHVVDLNGAVEGRPRNADQVEAIMAAVSIPIQVGGGIRSIATVRDYLSRGVGRVVLGTVALTNPALLEEACAHYPGRIVVGIDARDGKVAVNGWTDVSTTPATALISRLSVYPLTAIIYTDIARDGMLAGPNIPALGEVAAASHVPVIASGGISRLEDLQAVQAIGPRIVGAIVGKALYEGMLDLSDVMQRLSAPC